MINERRGSRRTSSPAAELPSAADAAAWFTGRLPDGWFTGPATVTVDREEIVVVGDLAAPEPAGATQPAEPAEHAAAAAAGRIERFREDTRTERMAIADQAQQRYGRTVSWGATCGESRSLFTHAAVPVMTRLRQPERRVLDTLVDAGVARSRSEALAWSVRLVGQHAEDWLGQLRTALTDVERLRADGPTVT